MAAAGGPVEQLPGSAAPQAAAVGADGPGGEQAAGQVGAKGFQPCADNVYRGMAGVQNPTGFD